MSEMIVNKLTGKTSAGSIDIVSEGGNATMQLQQGLAKAWANYDTTGTTEFRDSFNHSSLTDNNTGDTTLNITNNFANANYSVTMMGGRAGATGSFYARYNDNVTVPTAGLFRIQLIDFNGAGTDGDRINVTTHGDLA